MRKFLLLCVTMLGMVTSLMADEATVTQSSFTAIEGNVNGDANISYVAAKGRASTAPGVYNNQIRIYQNGGIFTVTANNGCKIKTVILGSSTNTALTYTLGTASASEENMLSAGKTVTVDAKDSTSVLFTCTGTDKNSRINVNYLQVTYDDGKVAQVAKPTFSPDGGSLFGPQKVTISCDTEGATLKYSTDGTTYTDYSEPVTISESCTLYAQAFKGDDKSAVATAAFVINPAYASLADLVAAGAPTKTAAYIQLTFTDEKIVSIAKTASGTPNGIYLKSGSQEVELYLSGLSTKWEQYGKVSGTVTGQWVLYSGIWELKLDAKSWDNVTYTAPVLPFTATDKNGKAIKSKFAASPLTVMYADYADGMTFQVNGKTKTYDAEKGLSLPHTASKNENDTVRVYNGDEMVAEQIFTWIPTVNVTAFKMLADNSEAILKLASGNKVAYVSSDANTFFVEDASQAVEAYNLGLKEAPKAYKTISAGSIWGTKKTFNNIVEITLADSTATNATLTQTETDVTPTQLTVAQAKTEANQLRYAKTAGAQVLKAGTQYKIVCASDTIIVYDKFATKVMDSVEDAQCYADITYMPGITSTGILQLWPLAIENISNKITGTFGEVTWTIDLKGQMVFTPTNGVSGTMDNSGYKATAKNPWFAYNATVKNVKFDAGVSANTSLDYMFYKMDNLETVDFTNLNTSEATSAKSMFSTCGIKALDLSGLDLTKVTTFENFANTCANLETVDFGTNTLAASTSFASMFYADAKLKTALLKSVTGEAATKVSSMFYGCSSLKTVDLRSFSTAAVSKASNMDKFFGTGNYLSKPDTLIISKSFGKISTGDYVALPAVDYMAVNAEGVRIDGTDFLLTSDTNAQASLYAYNEGLADFGTYVPYDENAVTTAIEKVATSSANGAIYNIMGQKVNANAKGIVIINGKKYVK